MKWIVARGAPRAEQKPRMFLAGSLPVLGGTGPAVEGSKSATVSVAGAESRRPDICLVYDELGERSDCVSLRAAEEVDPRQYSTLRITCPDYPYHLELSDRMLDAIRRFLEAGRGVFAEFTTNFPGASAAPKPQKTGIARLFVAEPPPGVEDPLAAGIILDEHDSVCMPRACTARAFFETWL